MKKFTIIFLLFNVALFSFLACKTDASSSEPGVMRKVTVIPNGGKGLSTEEYQVESGKTLNALSNMPTMTYATFTGFTDTDGNPFKLGETTVNKDMTIVMQWKWNDFSDCTNKGGTLQSYLDSSDVFGVACALKAGASLTTNIANVSPLLYAAQVNPSLDVLKYLLENGADLKQKDDNGRTAFLRSTLTAKLDIVKYLVYKGASVSDRDNSNSTALILAATNAQLELVKYLLTLDGVNINDKDNSGMTALMNAASSFYADSLATVKYLASSANISLKDTATAGIYSGLDALGIAKRLLSQFNTSSSYYTITKSIVDYLTTIW